MYFDTQTLAAILTDEAVRARTAEAIAAARKRFTSPLAVIGAALALAGQSGKTREEAETAVQAFLDESGIEVRDLPPAHRLIKQVVAAAPDGATAADIGGALDKACAEYYEVDLFSVDAPAAADPETPAES